MGRFLKWIKEKLGINKVKKLPEGKENTVQLKQDEGEKEDKVDSRQKFKEEIKISVNKTDPEKYSGEQLIVNILGELGVNQQIINNPEVRYELNSIVRSDILKDKKINRDNIEDVKAQIMQNLEISEDGKISYAKIMNTSDKNKNKDGYKYSKRTQYRIDEKGRVTKEIKSTIIDLDKNGKPVRDQKYNNGNIKRNLKTETTIIDENGIEIDKIIEEREGYLVYDSIVEKNDELDAKAIYDGDRSTTTRFMRYCGGVMDVSVDIYDRYSPTQKNKQFHTCARVDNQQMGTFVYTPELIKKLENWKKFYQGDSGMTWEQANEIDKEIDPGVYDFFSTDKKVKENALMTFMNQIGRTGAPGDYGYKIKSGLKKMAQKELEEINPELYAKKEDEEQQQ